MLSSRTEQILSSIVRTYIETGEPVASSAISRMRRFRLSPASIRNIMAELAAEGYLQQPHTSSGRVPTEKAFGLFARGLQGKRLHQEEVGRIREKLSDAQSVVSRVERCSHMLMEMTDGLGITAAIPTASQTLEQIELVPLGGRRVLMIVMTSDKLVRDTVVTLEEPVTQDQLNSVRNYVNFHFGGWVIADAQKELRRRLAEASAAYDEILRKLILLYDKGLFNSGLEPQVHMEGASNLVIFDFQTERLKDMLRALEEKKRILQLLERFLEQPAGKVEVKIGLGEADPSFQELSLIGISVRMPGGMDAKIAVVGPMRMDYERAVSAVLHLGRAFSSIPS